MEFAARLTQAQVSIHTPTQGVTLLAMTMVLRSCINVPPTIILRVTLLAMTMVLRLLVSIHTPTQGVTYHNQEHYVARKFQSTHPRRVWLRLLSLIRLRAGFNPHTHAGCDLIVTSICMASLRFQSTHPRRVWQALQCGTSHFLGQFQSTHPRRVWLWLRW